MLTFLIYFACGRQDEIDQSENPMEFQGKPDPKHQRMLRECKVIDALFLMLSAPMKGKFGVEHARERSSSVGDYSQFNS